jgi:hypothetical protein
MHGSTVTYKVISDRGYSEVCGVRVLSDKIASIASSSACLVAYLCPQLQLLCGALRFTKYTHVSQLVRAISGFGNDGPVPDKYASNWDLADCNSFFCLRGLAQSDSESLGSQSE